MSWLQDILFKHNSVKSIWWGGRRSLRTEHPILHHRPLRREGEREGRREGGREEGRKGGREGGREGGRGEGEKGNI